MPSLQGMVVAFLTFEAMKDLLGAGETKRQRLQEQERTNRDACFPPYIPEEGPT